LALGADLSFGKANSFDGTFQSCAAFARSAGAHRGGKLYRGADVGRHAARISPVIERGQLGIGDDHPHRAERHVQFFGDDLSEARAGAAADVGRADKQFDLPSAAMRTRALDDEAEVVGDLCSSATPKAVIGRSAFFPALELRRDFQQAIAQRNMVGAIARRCFVAGDEDNFSGRSSTGIDAELLRNHVHLRFAAQTASGCRGRENGQPRSLLV
jgi:hypothetical protein